MADQEGETCQGESVSASLTDLASRDPISLNCGFSKSDHFARYYRHAFGELPSATLACFMPVPSAAPPERVIRPPIYILISVRISSLR
jgi:AraC-like DNA-binding protein